MKKLSIFMLAMIALLCLLPFIGGCQEFDSKSWSDHISSKPERPEWLIGTDSIPIDEELKEAGLYSSSTTSSLSLRSAQGGITSTAIKYTGLIFSGTSPKEVLRFSFKNDSIHTSYSNLDSAGIALAREVQKIVQLRLDEKQRQIDSLQNLTTQLRKESKDFERLSDFRLNTIDKLLSKNGSTPIVGANDTIPTTGGILTLGGNVYQMTGTSTPNTKTDTISVRVICEQTSGNGWYSSEPVAKFRSILAERQLKWEAWWKFSDADGDGFGYDVPASDWVVKSTRYLEPIEGCYQLIPLKE